MAFSSSKIDDVWVYHEKQMSSLCGQHCINNLVQGAHYSAADLAEIAHELDAQERAHMLSEGAHTPDAVRFLAEDSGNVDEAGNFSVQVLNAALTRLYGLHLVSAGSELVGGQINTTGYGREGAFVLNRHAHWIAIRMVGGTYWDLNSMLDYPKRITTFALEATLHQLRTDGYSVFVVRGGELPPVAAKSPGEGARDCWYRVEDLLKVASGKSGGSDKPATAATDVWLNSGPGNRLGGGPTAATAKSKSGTTTSAGSASTKDELLARALAASLQEGGDGGSATGGASSGYPGGGVMEDDDDVARAIALSLLQQERHQNVKDEGVGAAEGLKAGVGGGGVYLPQPVPQEEPTGPEVVRVQLRLDGNKRIVRRFRRSDSISLLFDVAAHALAEADSRPIAAPFDVIDPDGKPLLKAGSVIIREATDGSAKDTTIGSERLGGASLLVRRAR